MEAIEHGLCIRNVKDDIVIFQSYNWEQTIQQESETTEDPRIRRKDLNYLF